MYNETFCCFCSKRLYPWGMRCYYASEDARKNPWWKKSCPHYRAFLNNEPLLFNDKKMKSLMGIGERVAEINISSIFSYVFYKFPILKKKRFLKTAKFLMGNSSSDPTFFHPNINADLIPRFIQMFDTLEQYLFAFSSREVLKLIEIKPLIIAKNMTIYGKENFLPNFEDFNILITESFRINHLTLHISTFNDYKRIFGSITSKTLIVKVKVLKLWNIEISLKNFFLLLSPKINVLSCSDVKMTPEGRASKIIEKIPNIQILFFNRVTIKYDNLWIKKLLKNWKTLKNLLVPLESLPLTPECLPLVFEKNQKNASFLNINHINEGNNETSRILSKFIFKIVYFYAYEIEYRVTAEKISKDEKADLNDSGLYK